MTNTETPAERLARLDDESRSLNAAVQAMTEAGIYTPQAVATVERLRAKARRAWFVAMTNTEAPVKRI